ncbi:MAG: tetratricopeptide repeat protein [Anaerolineae bacterium]|jgi:Zn-dependent protease
MDKLINWPPSWNTLFLLPALFLAFTMHELAHALVAYLLGDTSQVERKRLSLNPLRHVSWLGMAAFLLVGIGWAKPVLVDYTRFRIKNRAFGMFLVSVAGASINLLTALLVFLGMAVTATLVSLLNGVSPVDVFLFLLTQEAGPDALGVAVALSTYMVNVNLLLALFNLLPLPPLDGFQALMSLFGAIRYLIQGPKGAAPVPQPTSKAEGEEESALSPAQIHFNIALDYQKSGALDEAIARYRQALAHDEGLGLAYYNLGLVYLAKGRLPLASSAFKAAMQSGRDVAVQVEANHRLHEIARAEQSPTFELGPVPPPLEPGSKVEATAGQAPPLDPTVSKRLWLRLGLGGAFLVVLAGAAWLFVTLVTLSVMG